MQADSTLFNVFLSITATLPLRGTVITEVILRKLGSAPIGLRALGRAAPPPPWEGGPEKQRNIIIIIIIIINQLINQSITQLIN